MGKLIQKALCILLTAVSLSAVLSPSLTAKASSGSPIVFVKGQGCSLYKEANNPSSEEIYPFKDTGSYINSQISPCLQEFSKAVLVGTWDSYCNALYNAVAPVFEDIVLNSSGNVKDNSGVNWSWSPSTLKNNAVNGQYSLFGYSFLYDWRLDPCAIADDLASYIDGVLKATGASKVCLVGRCLGANIVMAYLAKYGCAKIDTSVFYVSCIDGVSLCSKSFAGKMSFDLSGMYRYAADNKGEGDFMVLLEALLSAFKQNSGLNLTGALFDRIYSKIKSNIVPRLLLATYATMPSFWSLVSSDDYEMAKKLVFGNNTAQYAGLIKKIDNYHYNVQVKAEGILKNLKAQGMKIGVVTKYNRQLLPVIENSNAQSDGVLNLDSMSFGATCSTVDKVLGDSYVHSAGKNDRIKYISPDCKIDASTCLFPDSTWFVRDIKHKNFPEQLNALILAICRSNKQYTVRSSSRYPQYLQYTLATDSISPLYKSVGMTDANRAVIAEKVKYFFKSEITKVFK